MGAFYSTYQLLRLKRRLFWPPEKLEALRRRKLAALLKFCYQHIPYYQEQFRHIGAAPEDFSEPADLSGFPLLDKETLRDRSDEFLDPQVDRSAWIPYRSSGSTGIPLQLWYHPRERLRMGFTVTREFLHNGLKPWFRLVNITEPRHSSSKNRWYHRVGIMKEQFLSVYDQSELNLARSREIKPHLLIGFPSVLMLIGRKLREMSIDDWRPKLLFTLAEVLTDADRELLTSMWGVEPIDLYGANEVGHVAFQCAQRKGYHMNLDSLHVEIVTGDKSAPKGQTGEVVVTNFDLRVMPIIRYRVGDVAAFFDGECACGCRFPMLERIAGRSDGFIIASDGKLYSALEVSLLLKSVAGIERFRIIQEQPNALRLEWVASGPSSCPEAEICHRLQERLGRDMAIQIERVASIARERSGKIRTVISTLPHPFHAN